LNFSLHQVGLGITLGMFKLYQAYYRALEHPHQYITQHILDEEKPKFMPIWRSKMVLDRY
jgi:hypothetical protein